MPNSPYLELLDWRRQVGRLFADLRSRSPDAATLAWFRAQKDRLFKDHPQSPIPLAERDQFTGLAYWPFDASRRVEARFTPVRRRRWSRRAAQCPPLPRARWPSPASATSRSRARLRTPLSLGAFWIEGYAGGLFVPFIDATSNHETYGGGRYLLDTIKSADLGPGAAGRQAGGAGLQLRLPPVVCLRSDLGVSASAAG